FRKMILALALLHVPFHLVFRMDPRTGFLGVWPKFADSDVDGFGALVVENECRRLIWLDVPDLVLLGEPLGHAPFTVGSQVDIDVAVFCTRDTLARTFGGVSKCERRKHLGSRDLGRFGRQSYRGHETHGE